MFLLLYVMILLCTAQWLEYTMKCSGNRGSPRTELRLRSDRVLYVLHEMSVGGSGGHRQLPINSSIAYCVCNHHNLRLEWTRAVYNQGGTSRVMKPTCCVFILYPFRCTTRSLVTRSNTGLFHLLHSTRSYILMVTLMQNHISMHGSLKRKVIEFVYPDA
jgi:hypothetical protein